MFVPNQNPATDFFMIFLLFLLFYLWYCITDWRMASINDHALALAMGKRRPVTGVRKWLRQQEGRLIDNIIILRAKLAPVTKPWFAWWGEPLVYYLLYYPFRNMSVFAFKFYLERAITFAWICALFLNSPAYPKFLGHGLAAFETPLGRWLLIATAVIYVYLTIVHEYNESPWCAYYRESTSFREALHPIAFLFMITPLPFTFEYYGLVVFLCLFLFRQEKEDRLARTYLPKDVTLRQFLRKDDKDLSAVIFFVEVKG